MKILLDECVTKRLKVDLEDYSVSTVIEMGWSGITNGKLLLLASQNGFDILLTIDKNIIHQQQTSKYSIIVAVLNSYSSRVEELIKFMPSFKAKIGTMSKGNFYILEKPE